MQSLQIKPNENAQPAVYEPKLNFKFYRQTRDDNELKDDNQDGFSALVAGLLDGNVDMLVEVYYHALAWYKRNQPSKEAVEDALDATVFASDEETDKAFDDIIVEMKNNNFLARKLSEYLKNANKNADMAQERIDSMDEKDDQRATMEIGLKQITQDNEHLKSLLVSGDSSPKPDAVDSHPEN